MNYIDRMQKIAVLGAAGKMGSGITALTLIECTDLSLLPENKDKTFVLYAIDLSEESLNNLLSYLKTQLIKSAEKKINWLRETLKFNQNLIENTDFINKYIEQALTILRLSSRIESAYNANVIFEAVIENPSLKIDLFKNINTNNKNNPWFLTNTSSIPIKYLNDNANLDGKIIGYHFYNPPVVQKLLEIIPTENTLPDLKEFAHTLAKKLKKTIVEANDVAGFIGNGHFMRDIIYAINECEKLSQKFSLPESIFIINKITQEYLIRPMGIFQLIDYVGLDVCTYILKVMNEHLNDNTLKAPLLEKFLEKGIKGGQNPDGTQKNGIFKYEKGKIIGIFDLTSNNYIDIESIKEKCEKEIGPIPSKIKPWKQIISLQNKEQLLEEYFNELKNLNTFGAKLALNYLKNSKEIGKYLVKTGVAKNEDDVNTVLITGFYHAYGPINNFIE